MANPKIPTAKTAVTNWGAFKEAGLSPIDITCEGYLPIHQFNSGCHSKLALTAEAMISHLDREHGGGFVMTLRKSNGPVWDGWDKFIELGIEITDFRCDVCDEVIKLNPSFILRHFAPHSGKMRRPKAGGTFNITISRQVNPEYTDAD